MTAILPLSLSASIRLQHWARQAGLEPKFDGEHWLLHLTPTPPVRLSQLPQSTTLHLVWSGLTWQLVGLTNASDFYDQSKTVAELSFDAERRQFWHLQAHPLDDASPPVLEQALLALHQQLIRGSLTIHSDYLARPLRTSTAHANRHHSP
ncbi:MAG: hypothetical protein ACRCXB_05535 [Aeromonadaceae bacterium]